VLKQLGLPCLPFLLSVVSGVPGPSSSTSGNKDSESCQLQSNEVLQRTDQSIMNNTMLSAQRVENILRLERLDVDSNFGDGWSNSDQFDLDLLFRKCMNADPNYGTLWFFCRQQPCDTARAVLISAKTALIQDMIISERVYMRATMFYVRRWLQEAQAAHFSKVDEGDFTSLAGLADHISTVLADFDKADDTLGTWAQCNQTLPLLDCHGDLFSPVDFVTALVELNRFVFNRNLSDEERRAVLFSSSHIIP